MIHLRKSTERGHSDAGWLKSWHSFSFGEYFSPTNRGFSDLRVINEDIVAPSGGFATHPHRDMEIFTYILSGQLQHKDSMGNGSVIRPGDVQLMSAGTGVTHSEFNPSNQAPVHLLQIWIFPSEKNLTPSYQQKHFPVEQKQGKLQLIISPAGTANSLTIHQDVRVYAGCFDGSESDTLILGPNRSGYVHVARGEIEVGNQRLQAGDAVACEKETQLVLNNGKHAEVIAFDLRG
jgi:quercetin 2,3-dioxygenase